MPDDFVGRFTLPEAAFERIPTEIGRGHTKHASVRVRKCSRDPLHTVATLEIRPSDCVGLLRPRRTGGNETVFLGRAIVENLENRVFVHCSSSRLGTPTLRSITMRARSRGTINVHRASSRC